MPQVEQKKPNASKTKLALLASACLICAPFVAKHEGLRTHPYLDPAKIATVCFGETELQMRVYSADECGVMLRARLMQDYAPAVARCLPELVAEGKSNALAAFVDAAYNAGVKAVCGSRMAARVHDGDMRGGCEGFAGWYVTAKGKRLPGLVSRRIDERNLCMKDLTIQIVPVDYQVCKPMRTIPLDKGRIKLHGITQAQPVV